MVVEGFYYALIDVLKIVQSEEEKKKSEEWRKSVEFMDEVLRKDDALRGLKLFVRMWKHEILNMIRQDKLRCGIEVVFRLKCMTVRVAIVLLYVRPSVRARVSMSERARHVTV